MPRSFRTPGVYVDEPTVSRPADAISSTVPAFVGYTQSAVTSDNASVRHRPHRITSMTEYHECFGGPPSSRFSILESPPEHGFREPDLEQDGKKYYLNREGQAYNLYFAMLQFFNNGGGPCYVVSVGGYSDRIETDPLIEGITALEKEPEPTLIVIPDAVQLDLDSCASVQIACLAHCGNTRNRFAILDIHRGAFDRSVEPDCIQQFRKTIGSKNLQWGAAYYPWLKSTVVNAVDVNYINVTPDSIGRLQTIVRDDIQDDNPARAEILKLIQSMAENASSDTVAHRHAGLSGVSPGYNTLMSAILDQMNLLPPSSAMAGVYTMVGLSVGVWKSPANITLHGVVEPSVTISNEAQEDLNVPIDGKSVNAIRQFVGAGTIVWGARTLDGLSLDRRYISVWRTQISLEQSLICLSKAYSSEPNDENTWAVLKASIATLLTDIWKRGGLAGPTPETAFSVHVGLGESMTREDLTEGILRVSVRVALSRPAEFSEITFDQAMQNA